MLQDTDRFNVEGAAMIVRTLRSRKSPKLHKSGMTWRSQSSGFTKLGFWAPKKWQNLTWKKYKEMEVRLRQTIEETDHV